MFTVQARAAEITGKGFKAGFSLADMNGDAWDDDFKPRPGFALGAFLTFGLTDRLSLQPEALFVQKGSRAEEGGWTFAARLNYFEMSILLKYALTARSKTELFVFAGPAVAMKFEAWFYTGYEGQTTMRDFSEVKSVDLGLTLGGGVGLPLGRNSLMFDIRYTLGLINCCNNYGGGSLSIKNSAVLFLVGIGF